MENVLLNLSDNQLSKLRNGENIQITPSQMGSGMKFRLNNTNIKKLKNAYEKAKAVRVALSDEEIEGSGLRSLRKGLKTVTHAANKINRVLHDDDLQRKVLSTSRQIKNTINKGDFIGDLGIPIVSDSYNLLREGVNDGDRLVRKGAKAKSKLVRDFDEANDEYNNTGSGVNPYLPHSKGGSFRVMRGGAKRTNVRLQTDSAININPTNPSFHPLTPKTFEEVMHGGKMGKCKYCNHYFFSHYII
jgi:hypothetical protein